MCCLCLIRLWLNQRFIYICVCVCNVRYKNNPCSPYSCRSKWLITFTCIWITVKKKRKKEVWKNDAQEKWACKQHFLFSFIANMDKYVFKLPFPVNWPREIFYSFKKIWIEHRFSYLAQSLSWKQLCSSVSIVVLSFDSLSLSSFSFRELQNPASWIHCLFIVIHANRAVLTFQSKV